MSEGKPAELSCSCSRLGWWASVCEKSARERARGFCVLVSETLAFAAPGLFCEAGVLLWYKCARARMGTVFYIVCTSVCACV